MALKTATGIMDSILMQAGNATDHLSDDDAKLLRSVIELVETSIYGSMDSSHGADESALGMAISQIEECNVDLTHRLGADGDLGQLHDSVSEKQTELNRLRGEMDAANATRQSEWEKFSTHMSMIREPESCPALPSRTMPALDVFFEKSEYSVWFAAAQAEYVAHRDAFVAADDALKAAVEAYNLQKARRDTQYCDWKRELEQSCENFETCFRERSRYYTDELTPRVQSDMASRIEAFKSGETLVQQIKFLLADSTTRETPEVDTSRFELGFPEVPAHRSCPLEMLEDDMWIPTVTCAHHWSVSPFVNGHAVLDGEGIRVYVPSYGTLKSGEETIAIDLKNGNDYVLHFNPRWGKYALKNGMSEDHVVRNTRIHGGHWQTEERSGGWPLGTIGSAFTADFVRTSEKWEISINGERVPALDYDHRSDTPVTVVSVGGEAPGYTIQLLQ